MDALRSLGHTVIYMPRESAALPCAYEEVEGVICNGLFLYHPIEKFTSLQYIQLTSAGFDRVPMEYIQECGIEIHNARGVYSIPMAEFALGGVLQLYKQAAFFAQNRVDRVWDKHRGLLELYGKTVCIVGCGSVGTECAKRFSAFGCRILGVDLRPTAGAPYDDVCSLSAFDQCLGQADIVILTLPLTEDTRGLMNGPRFRAMKEGSVLVNIARGAIVDEEALEMALEEKLMGAVLDVFCEEPLPEGHPLWKKDNVILTPHNSFVGDGNGERLYRVIRTNLEEMGRP